MSIGLRLKTLRSDAGITQKQLAEATGIPLQSLINYENGRRDPNSKALSALEQYFAVSGAYLRGEEEKNATAINVNGITVEIPSNPEEVADILSEFKNTMQRVATSLSSSGTRGTLDELIDNCVLMLQSFSDLSKDGQSEMLKRISEYRQFEEFKKTQNKALSNTETTK
ncbi:MAG: helix-turn-helix domain-containing protein [Oscillospiraceae bacterium]